MGKHWEGGDVALFIKCRVLHCCWCRFDSLVRQWISLMEYIALSLNVRSCIAADTGFYSLVRQGFHSWSISLSLNVESCVAADAGLIPQYSNRFSLVESTFSADSPNPMLCDQPPCPVETVASQALAAMPLFLVTKSAGSRSAFRGGTWLHRWQENWKWSHLYI